MELRVFEKGNVKVNFKVLDYDIQNLISFGKENKGLYKIDLLDKKVYWFDTVHDAAKYHNYSKGVEADLSSKEHLFVNDIFDVYGESIKGMRDNRVLVGSIFIQSRLFNGNVISENAAYLPRLIENSKGQKFDDLNDAVEYLRKEKIAKGTKSKVKKSIINNLEGKTKKSYGMEWFYV